MDSLLRDIRFGLKLLLKDRGFSMTTIVTLAVCIAANVAIFTIVNSVLLKPLPVPEAEDILLTSNQYPKAAVGDSMNSGIPDYYDRLRDVTAFEEQALFNIRSRTIEIDGIPERVRGVVATPSLFRLLRVPPVLGQIFDEEDGEIKGPDDSTGQKVILSYSFWQRLFAGSPDALGKTLRISGRPYTVLGVMPPDFVIFDPDVRFWIPAAFSEEDKSDNSRHSNNWYNLGRLKPGATLEQAQSQVDALNAANLERFPAWKEILANAGFYSRVDQVQEVLVKGVKQPLYLLWAGAAFVLLIGALNLANLALARATVRLRELRTRLALGAGRIRLVRQLVTESVLLSLAGGVGGLLLGSATLRLFFALGLENLPRGQEVQIDVTVILVTMGLSILVGLILGVVPVSQLYSVNLNAMLREEARGGTSGRGARQARRVLVVAQIGFTFVLMIGAGLLFASFRQLQSVDPGFNSDQVLVASTTVPAIRYPEAEQVRPLMDRIMATLRAVPGVTATGATTSIPFGGNYSDSVILAEGYEMQPGESLISPRNLSVTPGYFETMQIPIVRGRSFDERDNEKSNRVVIVDEKLASKFWPGEDPVGSRLYSPTDPQDLLSVNENTRWYTVIGVVKDVKLEDLAGGGNQGGTYYFPYAQQPFWSFTLVLKTAVDPSAVIRTLRSQMAQIDSELPLFDIRTMQEQTELSLAPRRAAMILAMVFGGVALFLSAIGIYGVLAYLVAQRSNEIGIRIALGSTAHRIFGLVLHEGIVLVAVGLGLGIAGAIGMGSAVESQLYGVRAMDPSVIILSVVVLGLVALLACLLPARRATRVDPVLVLNKL